MTRPAALLLMLTSSFLSCTAAATAVSIFCTWTKVSPDEQEVHYIFLRQAAASLRLYHSSWSGQRALRSCAWSDDAAVIHSYLALCRERTQEFSDHPNDNFDLDSMFVGEEEQCVSLASPGVGEQAGRRPVRSVGGPDRGERSEVRIHQRVKRGFIVPGTLWCGSGNKAPSYADLGVFSDTDSCCREHDQCKHTILSFHSQFGVFNTNIFTMSHCDCDNKFRSCLKEANDSIADVVGYTFFNLLKMNCFEFSHRLQCMQRNWFGMCKETQMALYAEVRPPTLYSEESINPTEDFMNSTDSIINSTIPAELPQSSTLDPQLFSITAAASTVPTPSTSSSSASITPVTNHTTSSLSGLLPERRNHLENAKNSTVTKQDITEIQSSCDIYKDLDECKEKILPWQKKYGLYNPELRTLYHCNCTTRFFQTLTKQRQVTEVQALLLGHVSQSCFQPRDCTAGSTCTAVVVKAELPHLDQSRGTEVEEQHHLQAVKLKVRRPHSRRARRKDRPVKLRRLCLRMSRSRNKARTQNAQQPAVRERARLNVNITERQSVQD
ncbi:group 3 secretory phospholipase A2 isoform X2 [Amphiprion ocellaris]|uniref:group 3 secretory phospholipase A2 isoform X2 n=1 Tax=Amphiprion ocellaris TaxID=80972 RepID=UPI002410C6B5|nr:group 3 secretory phospholipase A2 isoform X2 [Amphiprion ocellaris]